MNEREHRAGVEPIVDVVVRCRNEMPFAARAVEGLLAQVGVVPRLLFLDCGSTDGSREVAVRAGVRVLDVDPKAYVPGAVLNRGMAETGSAVVAFVNADAVPTSRDALARLVAPLLAPSALAATFGRQVPRSRDPLVRAEYERAFGAFEPARVRRGVFFSMAASAVSRDAWEELPFDEGLRYSEDVDWVYRVGALGRSTRYVPEAAFEHSHDYDLAALFARRRGEGAADRAIFRLGEPSIAGDLVRPLAGALARDARAGLLSLRGLAVRATQAAGYFVGRAS